MPKINNFLHDNHLGSPNLILLDVLKLLDVPKDASLACCDIFIRTALIFIVKEIDVVAGSRKLFSYKERP